MNYLKTKAFDNLLFFIVLTISFIGIIMIFSSSHIISFEDFNDSWYFFKRQIVFIGMGLSSLLVFSAIDYHKLKKISSPFFILSFILLFLLFLFPKNLGREVNGAVRWMDLGFVSFQPSELLKFSLIIFIADFLSKKIDDVKNFQKTVLPLFIILSIILLIIIKQPDLSTAMVILAVSFMMFFIGNVKIKHLLIPISLSGLVGLIAIIATPWRLKRIIAFLDPLKARFDGGYQIVQSLIALGSGGIFGKGLGESIQKFNYLPEAHTDYIFSIVGEELGFLGCLILIFLFVAFLIQGVRVATNAPDLFGLLLSSGIVFFITVQVIINVGVVTSMFPPTGIPLPFVSYGGTSIIILLSMVGVLLNISKYSKVYN